MTTPDDAFRSAMTAVSRNGSNGRSAEEIRAVIEEIFSNKNLRLRSKPNKGQVLAVARAISFAERYGSDELLLLVDYLLELKVSEDTRGRDDMVEGIRAAVFSSGMVMDGQQHKLSLRERLLGTGR